MSRVLHLVLLQELVVLRWNDLEKVVQSFFVLLVIASSHEIELAKRAITALEVVRELILLIYSYYI